RWQRSPVLAGPLSWATGGSVAFGARGGHRQTMPANVDRSFPPLRMARYAHVSELRAHQQSGERATVSSPKLGGNLERGPASRGTVLPACCRDESDHRHGSGMTAHSNQPAIAVRGLRKAYGASREVLVPACLRRDGRLRVADRSSEQSCRWWCVAVVAPGRSLRAPPARSCGSSRSGTESRPG